MTDEPTYHDTPSSRGLWDSAPEVRAQRAKPAKPIEPQGSSAEVEQLRARAEAAEGMLYQAHESGLETVAFGDVVDFEDTAATAAFADALLTNPDEDGFRLAEYIQRWGEADPDTASAWAADRERHVDDVLRQREHEMITDVQHAELLERARISERFREKHPDPAGDTIADSVPLTSVPTDELASTLETAHEGFRAADRARLAAEREAQIRNAFREPRFGEDFSRNTLGRQPVEVTEADVAARIQFDLPGEREERRDAEVSDFRRAFADEARPKFGPGARPR